MGDDAANYILRQMRRPPAAATLRKVGRVAHTDLSASTKE